MKSYEMVTILDPGLDPAAYAQKSSELQERIKSHGGEILNVAQWGKRKLAYDIMKKDAGYYLVINFQTTPKGLIDFKEGIKHDQEILRYLVIVEPKSKYGSLQPRAEAAEETQARVGARGKPRGPRRGDEEDESEEEEA